MRRFPLRPLPKEFKIFKKLNSPSKIQSFLNKIPTNFELHGETCNAPLVTLQTKKAHCIEGATLAAAILWFHGQKPLLLDLKTTDNDQDHVIALFRQGRCWGAISKTNHNVLRFRDPIYKTIRELVLSYFNEYFLDTGEKTLRSYSKPFDLSKYDDNWMTSEKGLWKISEKLDFSRHINILPVSSARKNSLRKADEIEIRAGKLLEWRK